MIIEELALRFYGHHRDVVLDLRPPHQGLVLVFGPNEAGKSTTMRAIDALLFGIHLRNRDHFGEGRKHLRIGATLRGADGKVVEVERNSTRKALTDARGGELAESVLVDLMDGVDQQVFSALFHLDHEALGRGSEELLSSEGEIGRLLFGASLGVGVVPIVQSRLDDRASELFKSGGSKPRLNEAMRLFGDARSQAKLLRIRPREFDELTRERSELEARLAEVTADIAKVDARRSALDRVRRVSSELQKRARSLEQLEQIGASGSTPTTAWCEEVERLLDDHEAKLAAIRSGRDEIEKMRTRRETITVDSALLEQRDHLSAAVQELAAVETRLAKAVEDQVLIDQQSAKLEKLLAQDDDSLLGVAVVDEEQRAIVDGLVEQRGLVVGELEGARRRLDEAQARALSLGVTVNAPAADGEAADGEAAFSEAAVVPMEDAVDRSRNLAAAKTALGVAEKAVAKLVAGESTRVETADRLVEVRVLATKLGIRESKPGEHREIEVFFDSIRSFRGPSRRRSAEAVAAIAELAARRTDRQRVVQELGRRIAERESSLTDLRSGDEAPTADRLGEVRAERDAQWVSIRARFDGEEVVDAPPGDPHPGDPQPGDPQRFEAAVNEADRVADRRYEQADLLAQLASVEADLARDRAELEAATADLVAVEESAVAADLAWAELWEAAAEAAPAPSESESWFVEFDRLLERVADLERRITQEDEVDQASRRAMAALETRMIELGCAPASEPPELALADAQRELSEVEQEVQAAAMARQLVEAAVDGLRDRTKDLAAAELAMADWQAKWDLACASAGLNPGIEPTNALSAIRTAEQIAASRQTLAELEAGVIQAHRSRDAFEEHARTHLTAAIGESGDQEPGFDVLRTEILAASSRIEREIVAKATLDELVERLSERVAEVERSESAAAQTAQRLDELWREVGAVDGDRSVEERDRALLQFVESGRLAERESDALAAAETAMLEGGDGLSIDALVEEAAAIGFGPDELIAELASLEAQRQDLDSERAELHQLKGDADARYRRIDGSEAAADADQLAADQLAVAAEAAEEYLVVSTAAELLRRVVADFAEHHQGPIVAASSAIFERLTEGRYTSLVTEMADDNPVVLALSRSGSEKQVSELSAGTRDQLYLALRLATVQHHYEELDVRVPLILDDLLVNFDDERKASALRVLAEFGSTAQVLMFTHEASLVDVAQATLGPEGCSVVRLPRPD